MQRTIKTYYWLTKPGIVYGNALTIIAGFFLATSFNRWTLWQFFGALVGTSLVIASACVINNVIDRRVDILMERTKKRALVTGEITSPSAIVYGIILGLIGFIVLGLFTNWLTVALGVLADLFYIVLYGASKRRSEHSTLVGSVSGALPPVAGYIAVTNRLDIGVIILFLMLVFWQMAHFYAIAIYRRKEYAAAGLPILSVTRGNRVTLVQTVVYIVGFVLASLELSFAGYTGWLYVIVMLAVSGWWLLISIKALQALPSDVEQSAKKLFFVSLVVNIVMCLMVAVGGYLP